MFLVDTSVWIFALKKNSNPRLKNRIDRLLEIDEILSFGMIKLELLGGTKTSEEFHRLKKRLDAIYEISADNKLWESASQLAFDLRRKGLTVPATDTLIASAAIYSKSVLLHADMHFNLIADCSKLKVESYAEEI
jgi:predicted nucleic acid-binding protein